MFYIDCKVFRDGSSRVNNMLIGSIGLDRQIRKGFFAGGRGKAIYRQRDKTEWG